MRFCFNKHALETVNFSSLTAVEPFDSEVAECWQLFPAIQIVYKALSSLSRRAILLLSRLTVRSGSKQRLGKFDANLKARE